MIHDTCQVAFLFLSLPPVSRLPRLLCTWACIRTHMCALVWVWRPMSFIGLELAHYVRLAGRPSLPPLAEITRRCAQPWLFRWVLGIKLMSLCLQTSTVLSLAWQLEVKIFVLYDSIISVKPIIAIIIVVVVVMMTIVIQFYKRTPLFLRRWV